MATITPILDRIVVKRDEEKTVSAGGIVLPGATAESPAEGTVLAVGPGKVTDKGERIPMHLVPGNKIVFSKFAGTEVTVDNVTYLIMKEEDILGIVT